MSEIQNGVRDYCSTCQQNCVPCGNTATCKHIPANAGYLARKNDDHRPLGTVSMTPRPEDYH